MFRAALIAFALLVAALAVLAVLPAAPRVVPESAILLETASVRLYPVADPEAVWRFVAPEVSYRPGSRETTLYRVNDGAREVGGATDFTLESEEVVIDSEDNLRGEAITARLSAEAWTLAMRAQGARQVLIDQRAGRFEIPHLDLSGEGVSGTYENMRISFDLETFEAGGPGTVGVSSFEIGSPAPNESNESEDP